MRVLLWHRLGWFLTIPGLGPIAFGCTSSKEITSVKEADGKEILIRARGEKVYRLHSYEADSTKNAIRGKGILLVSVYRLPFEGAIESEQIEHMEVAELELGNTFLLFMGACFAVGLIGLASFRLSL